LNTRKKVAFVANTTWFISNFKVNLIKYLEDKGYEIYVIAPLDDYLGYLNQLEFTHHIPIYNLSRKGVNPFQDLRLIFEIYKIYKNLKPDLILHYTIKPNIYGSIAATLVGIKSIMIFPGLGHIFMYQDFRRLIISKFIKFIGQYSKKILFENTDDLEVFVKMGIIPQNKGFAFKGVGVDTEHFKPMPSTRNNDKIIFTFLGRLIYGKGIREFYEAASWMKVRYPNTEFWIVGGIDNQNPEALKTSELLSWIESKVIRYWGQTADVREYIRNSDCIVLPSYYPEGVPKVLQEGMSMEKPIITTDMPGCREAVEDGKNGFCIKAREPHYISSAMEKIYLMSPKERLILGQYGRIKAVKELDYSISNVIYYDFIREAIED
jgi:glycosyltransferase involved in cell wall biosynthesis